MIHTIAFSTSVSATTTVLTNLAAVADPVVRVSGNFVYLPDLSSIGAVYAIGSGLSAAQLQAPGLRSFINQDITPLDTNSTVTNPTPYLGYMLNPIKLQKDEALSALSTTNVPGAALRNTVIVHLTDGPTVPVTGDIHTIKFTLTAVAGDYTWNNAAITLSQSLPVGSYDIVGARLEGSGLIAFRLVPVGAIFRPGFIACPTPLFPDPDFQRAGRGGVFCTFNELTPPTIDTFGASVSGTLTGYFDLIKKA